MGYYFLYVFTTFFNCLSPVVVFAQGFELRENKVLRLSIVSAVTAVLYIICSLLYFYLKSIFVYYAIYAIVSIVLLAIYLVLFKDKFLNLLFLFISTLYVSVFISCIKEALYCFLEPIDFIANIIEKDSVSENILQLVIVGAMVVLLFFSVRKRKNLFREFIIEWWTVIIYAISWIIFPLLTASRAYGERNITNGMLNIVQALVALLVLYFQFFVRSFEKKKHELKLRQREFELIEYEQAQTLKRYEQESSHYEFIANKCHDLKKQINLIQQSGSVQNGNAIKDIEKSLSVYETSAHTGNSSLDILISEKAVICKNNNIDFACLIDGQIFDFLDVIDLFAIFGNAIDNAIEYLLKINYEKRYLRIRQCVQNGIILLLFENYIENEIDYSETSKSDKYEHGFGLKSIKYSVEKYNGILNIKEENNLFIVEIAFPLN